MKKPRQRMEFKLRAHPSGRPIPAHNYTALGFTRQIHDEPLTPGLKPGRQRTHAIGFTAQIVADDE